MARLYVVVDQTGVARYPVKTFPLIFEEDPNKHRADRKANQCQAVCGIEKAVGCSCRAPRASVRH